MCHTCMFIYRLHACIIADYVFVSTCVCRKQTNDEIDRDVELPYYELERLYSGTPAGRAMLNDLRKNQPGVAHPDPKAHGMHENF